MIAALATVGLLAIVIGEGVTAATVAGLFSVLNLFLNSFMLKRQKETKEKVEEATQAASAPRRFVYNAEGRVIGSIPEPNREGDLGAFEPIREAPNGVRWSDEEGRS